MLLGIKQVLINIDEDKYEHICQKVRKAKNEDRYVHYEWEIIANGIVLPKGHGRLIDVNDIPIDCDYYDVDTAPTIIEADREDKQ